MYVQHTVLVWTPFKSLKKLRKFLVTHTQFYFLTYISKWFNVFPVPSNSLIMQHFIQQQKINNNHLSLYYVPPRFSLNVAILRDVYIKTETCTWYTVKWQKIVCCWLCNCWIKCCIKVQEYSLRTNSCRINFQIWKFIKTKGFKSENRNSTTQKIKLHCS
jgi:hypothetical protein